MDRSEEGVSIQLEFRFHWGASGWTYSGMQYPLAAADVLFSGPAHRDRVLAAIARVCEALNEPDPKGGQLMDEELYEELRAPGQSPAQDEALKLLLIVRRERGLRDAICFAYHNARLSEGVASELLGVDRLAFREQYARWQADEGARPATRPAGGSHDE